MKIKHVYGNVLRIDIPLTIKIINSESGETHEVEEPFYPDTSKPVLVELANQYNITKYTYEATIDGNVAHIEDYGNIRVGVYKVTVKCFDEYNQPYRYMVRDIIEICDATIDAGVEAGIEFDSETYTLEGAVFISYGGGSFEQVQADWTEADTHSKAYIKNKPTNLVDDESYVHTDNNYTDAEKEKLAELENYDDTEIKQEISGKVDKEQGKGLSTNDYTNEDKQKVNSALQSETDPTVPSWAKQPNKPSYTAQEVGALPNNTKYGSTIDFAMDSATYVLTLSLKDQDGTALNTKTVDLPIESVVVNGRYDAANKKIVLTLQSGSTIDVPVGDLIAGLQTEITSVNMLDSDLVDDTNSTHKFVTLQEKQAWNNKSDFSGSYNDLSDKPTIPAAQIQSDWNQADNTQKDFIKNKPSIPAAQVNADWNADSGVAQILNKPTIPDTSDCIKKSSTAGLVKNDGTIDTNTYLTQNDISGKADKSEMSVTDGTGADSDKTTIQLKSGTSATVLKSHQSLAGKQDVIDAQHKLSADLVDDTNSTNKFTNATEKQAWNNKQDALVSGTNIKTINNESILGSGNITIQGGGGSQVQSDWEQSDNTAVDYIKNKPTIPIIPSNTAYLSSDSGEGIVPDDGIRAVTVTSAAAMTVNPDVVTVINGAVGTADITLQVPQDNLAHVWDILMTTDSTVAIIFAMSNSATILAPSGFSIGASKAVEVSVIGVGTKYYLRYGEFA